MIFLVLELVVYMYLQQYCVNHDCLKNVTIETQLLYLFTIHKFCFLLSVITILIFILDMQLLVFKFIMSVIFL